MLWIPMAYKDTLSQKQYWEKKRLLVQKEMLAQSWRNVSQLQILSLGKENLF